MPIGNRAVPDIMVTFAMPDKNAAVLFKESANPFFIFGHYIAILSWRSETNDKLSGLFSVPFSSSSSGTA